MSADGRGCKYNPSCRIVCESLGAAGAQPILREAGQVAGIDGAAVVQVGGGVGVSDGAPGLGEEGEVDQVHGRDAVKVGAVGVAEIARSADASMQRF
jgi:hypothetical protein